LLEFRSQKRFANHVLFGAGSARNSAGVFQKTALFSAGVKGLVRRQNIHCPNGPTNRVLDGDSKIIGVVKLDVGSTILGRNDDLQNIFVEGANFYSKTNSVEIISVGIWCSNPTEDENAQAKNWFDRR
jgi:hypothetical protein